MSDLVEVYLVGGQFSHTEDGRTVPDTITIMENQVNNYRDNVAAYTGIWYMGHFWDSSPTARSNLTGVMSSVLVGLPLPSNFVWRDNNNNNVPFTTTNLITLGGYLVEYVNQIYNYSWYLKSNIDNCVTLSQLDAINPLAGWPDGNMDGTMPINFGLYSNISGVVGQSFEEDFWISGGIAPYTLSITEGSLPPGLEIANNSIVGTPTTVGTTTFTIQATDSTANTPLTNAHTYSISVISGINIYPTVFTTDATKNETFEQTFTVTGGTAPYTLSVTSGSLPNGLTVSGASIVGTPTSAGIFDFTLTVTDSSETPLSESMPYVLEVDSPAPITIAPAFFKDGAVGNAYVENLTISGGNPPYVLTLEGSLPGGLVLSNNSITGTPTTAGGYSFTVIVTDAEANALDQAYTILVKEADVSESNSNSSSEFQSSNGSTNL